MVIDVATGSIVHRGHWVELGGELRELYRGVVTHEEGGRLVRPGLVTDRMNAG